MNGFLVGVGALIPSIGVGILFSLRCVLLFVLTEMSVPS